MVSFYRITSEMFSGKPPFRYPKGSGITIMVFVIVIFAFFTAAGAFAKGGSATDCLLSLQDKHQKIDSMEECFTAYRREWVMNRFHPVHTKMGHVRWGEPWSRPIMDKVVDGVQAKGKVSSLNVFWLNGNASLAARYNPATTTCSYGQQSKHGMGYMSVLKMTDMETVITHCWSASPLSWYGQLPVGGRLMVIESTKFSDHVTMQRATLPDFPDVSPWNPYPENQPRYLPAGGKGWKNGGGHRGPKGG